MDSTNTTIVNCILHPNKLYQYGAPESYYLINLPIIVVNLILLVFIVLGNATVLLAYCRNKALQSVPNMLLITLAVTDLLVGLAAQPLFLATLIRDVLGAEPLCLLALLSSLTIKFCGGASLMTLGLVISVERYIAICHPFKHRRWVTKTRIKRVVLVVWSYVLALCGSLILGMPARAYLLILSISTFIGMAATAFACCGILMKMNLRRRRQFSVEFEDGQVRIQGRPESTSSNGEETRDCRIFVTMSYIIGAIFVCYLPMFAAIIYAQVKRMDELYLKYFYPIAMTMIFLNSFLNPVIYCLRNRKFVCAIRQICKSTRIRNSSNSLPNDTQDSVDVPRN